MCRSTTRLVVGLGNPGPRYRGTRHNVGFEVLDRLAERVRTIFESPRELFEPGSPAAEVEALLARVPDPAPCPAEDRGARRHGGLLVKPQTFMNLSGEAVRPLVEELELEPGAVLVVFDDMDLPAGKLRLRPHGGGGGQRGMTSIIELLGTDRFPRLRVGIGRPETDAARHVLSVFDPAERERIDAALDEAAEAIGSWLAGDDIEACMTRFHSRWNQGPEGPAPSTNEL